MPDLAGKTLLGRYRVDAFLGRGGMAEVYRAWDARRSVYVALKVLNEDLAEDYVFLRRFVREARALELLQHPHVVRFFGFEESQGLAFLVMEYIDGVTLRRQLKLLERPLTLPEALAVLQPVCGALHYAHGMGIFHCDVKPANVFIERGGRVVLGDFGIARLSESATVTFSTPGTPAYMAPEQCRGEDVNAQTDVYSLGVTTYEMLTLDRPFKGEIEGTAGSRGERVRWEQMHVPPPRPRIVNSRIPPAAEAAILQALEKEPTRRQQGALEFYGGLSKGGRVQAVAALPWVSKAAAVTRPPAPVAEPMTASPGVERRKRAGVLTVVGGVVAVLVCVLGLVLLTLAGPLGGGDGEEGAVATLAAQLTAGAQTATAEVALRLTDTRLPPPPTATPMPRPTDTSLPAGTHTLTPRPTSTAMPATDTPVPPPPPPQPQRIAFVRVAQDTDRNSRLDWNDRRVIYVMDADGGSLRRLTDESYDSYSPAWSPDGGQIAFAARHGGDWEIYVVDADGTNEQALTSNAYDDCGPSWSPDGRSIAFYSDRDGNDEIYVMNNDGTGHVNVTRSNSEDWWAAWSPDGRTIAFTSDRYGHTEICLLDVSTRSVTRLTHSPVNCASPAWSPDGLWIAFAYWQTGKNCEIYRVDSNGRNLERLTDHPGLDTRPAWSP